jgi:hypothetical protein
VQIQPDRLVTAISFTKRTRLAGICVCRAYIRWLLIRTRTVLASMIPQPTMSSLRKQSCGCAGAGASPDAPAVVKVSAKAAKVAMANR